MNILKSKKIRLLNIYRKKLFRMMVNNIFKKKSLPSKKNNYHKTYHQ